MVARGVCVVAPGGACMVTPRGGMHGCSRGHAWLLQGACVAAQGACVAALGGHAWLLPGGACMVAPGGHVWLLWGGMCGCSGGHAWDTMRYGDTVNERAVSILLECILVYE